MSRIEKIDIIKYLKILLAVIVVISLIYVFFKTYDPDYYRTVNLLPPQNLENAEKTMGHYENCEIDGDITRLYYDGYDITYNGKWSQKLEITGEKYRTGIFRIGVGSRKCVIETIFCLRDKLVDLKDNEFGYYNARGLYIYFVYDDNNRVEKIIITEGP